MADIWEGLLGRTPWALATVVRQLRSAPRDIGTMMAVANDGTTIGNVSAGCVDAEVHAAAGNVLASGKAQLSTYGVSDERALAAGLSCGGAIEVLVTPAPAPELVSRITSSILADEPVALLTVLSPENIQGSHLVVGADTTHGSLGDQHADRRAAELARAVVQSSAATVVEDGETTYLVQWFLPRPSLLVFGAVAYAESISALGKLLGYRVVVCDARPVFATRERVPSADEVVVDWPHRYLGRVTVDDRTVILSLVHDEKFEISLLTLALRSPATYVGALGSRSTVRRRLEVLRASGLTKEELARLHAPMGLDLGARTAEETAVSIMGEVIASSSAGSGEPLGHRRGSIHRRPPA
jgi:xanthine dehydrogenase accessory factor